MLNSSDEPRTARGGSPSAWVWSQYRGETEPDQTPQTAGPDAAPAAPAQTADADTAQGDAGVRSKGSMAGPLVALVFVVTGIIFYAAWPSPKPPTAPEPTATDAPAPKADSAPRVEPAPPPAAQSVPPAPPAATPVPDDRGAAAKPASGRKPKKTRKTRD